MEYYLGYYESHGIRKGYKLIKAKSKIEAENKLSIWCDENIGSCFINVNECL